MINRILVSVFKQHLQAECFFPTIGLQVSVFVLFFPTSPPPDSLWPFQSVQVSACWAAMSLMPWRPQLWPSTSTSSTSTSAAGARRTTESHWTGRKAWQSRPFGWELKRHGFTSLSSASSRCCLSEGQQTSTLTVELRLEGQNVEC